MCGVGDAEGGGGRERRELNSMLNSLEDLLDYLSTLVWIGVYRRVLTS